MTQIEAASCHAIDFAAEEPFIYLDAFADDSASAGLRPTIFTESQVIDF